MTELAALTKTQIDGLALQTGRPLIISDADEVIVHFAEPLERFLNARDFYLDLSDYKLFGNVRRQRDKKAVPYGELMELLEVFFAAEVENLPPVAGAVTALNALQSRAQVVVLTNLPAPYRERRRKSFATHGLTVPIIANSGLKGAPVKALAELVQAPVVFIDDIEIHIRSVAAAVPESFRVHFIADRRLAAVEKQAPDSQHRCDRWPTTMAAINAFLSAEGF